jgi:hypothetical protein
MCDSPIGPNSREDARQSDSDLDYNRPRREGIEQRNMSGVPVMRKI